MRPIDADALKLHIDEWCGNTYVGINMAKAISAIIDKQPTVQSQQKTEMSSGARWLISSDGYYPYCSACLNEPDNGEMSERCPNCGRFMINIYKNL